jgi:hypothetical protein
MRQNILVGRMLGQFRKYRGMMFLLRRKGGLACQKCTSCERQADETCTFLDVVMTLSVCLTVGRNNGMDAAADRREGMLM